MQRALEKRELIVINDPKNTCTDCPLSRHYHGRSALTHRLGNFGILSVSVPAHFAHDREEQDLFVEVANDLAFALSKIEAEKRIHIKKNIIQTIPHPISLVSSSYRYLVVNKAYSRIYNETPGKITGRRITDFIDPEVFEQDIKPHLDRCLKGETVQYETLVDFPVIGNRWMRMEYTPFRDKDHQIVGVVSHGLDITERKHMEEQLRHAHKMEAIGTLAGGIAHEFNNMLGIIIGNTELALDDIPAWNPAADYIQEVKAASLRAKDVVRKLLSVARKTPESRKPIQIGSVIKDALDLMRRTIPATIDIRTNITCSSEMILGDITEIKQIVINLCTNSVHAMAEESGILEVGLDTRQMNRASLFYDEDLKPGDYVRLTVTDTGTGIDPAYMDRLYDPYFTTKDVDQGLGMGLAVVHGIVKKYDGAIKIESNVGRGTTVEVLFPLIEAQMEPKTEKSETLQKGKERILLVDDEPSIVRMITQMLTRCGYEVIGKTSSASALNVFKDAPEQFDLVISDLTMPEISGDQLAQEIKQIRPGMPIILCTGHSNRMDENKAKELGIDAFITKPFSRKNITEAIPKVLHKTNSESQDFI
ncbi:response regulator [Desulfobacter sp.]|uniref:hybrid sensor histidine kinase/response regulator n=1 Tax=Desulfobacter sp. TaxID=2294 RepID=UPI00257C9ACF|nr:response regulator [Desulfobacter sp.]